MSSIRDNAAKITSITKIQHSKKSQKKLLHDQDLIIDTETVLGKGSNSVVYKAILKTTNTFNVFAATKIDIQVAAKVSTSFETSDANKFVNELNSLSLLKAHPNIIALKGWTLMGCLPVIVTEIAEKSYSRFDKVNFRLVTAFSANHFNEALRSCYLIGKLAEAKHWEEGYFIAYLIGNDVSIEESALYQEICPFVELRQLSFSPYLVKNLKEYRWKPLIIEEVINEFEEIFWLDSSVVFDIDSKETIKGIFAEQNKTYSKCGIRQFEPTGHTIYAATNPIMYKYFNFTDDMAQSTMMNGATMFTVKRSPKSMEIIEKWVKCAKEKECMAPFDSQLKCDMIKIWNGEYANYHRFDQSALAILLRQQCSENSSDYFHPSPLVKVERL